MGTRTYLAGKIHGVVVTGTQIPYTESVTIGADMMMAAGIDPYQQVEVANLATGARFTTYAVPGQPGMFLVNGAAARLCSPGDRCSVMSYAQADAFAGANLVTVGTDNTYAVDTAFPFTLSSQSPDQAATQPQSDAQQLPVPQQAPAPADGQQAPQLAPDVPVQAPDGQQPGAHRAAPADASAQQWPDAPAGCLTAGDGLAVAPAAVAASA